MFTNTASPRFAILLTWGACGCFIAASCQARAAVSGQSAVRMVESVAGASVNGDAPPVASDGSESLTLGEFTDFALAVVTADNGTNALDHATATARADQTSLIQRKSAEAYGESRGSFEVNTSSGGGAFADAVSEFIYDFTLDAPTAYEVLGWIDAFGPVSDASLELLLGEVQIFAIGEASGYASSAIAQSGVLQPGTYQLISLADTIHSITGPSGTSPNTAGAEFAFGFFLDVYAPGEIVNGHFGIVDESSHDVFRWAKTGPGTVQVEEIDDDFRLVLQTDGHASVIQAVDAPTRLFFVEFDYLFLDDEGALDVRLGGVSIGSLTAPPVVETSLQHAKLLVADPALRDLAAAPLSFLFDAAIPGMRLHLDNVKFSLGMPGDFDGDGAVDGSDLGMWMPSFGLDALGDADGDGDADGHDFLLWQRTLGGSAAAAIPEPAGCALAFVALATAGRFSRRSLSRPILSGRVTRRVDGGPVGGKRQG